MTIHLHTYDCLSINLNINLYRYNFLSIYLSISPGYGFLYKLSNMLERCLTRPALRASPLIWRLLLWTVSIDSLRLVDR